MRYRVAGRGTWRCVALDDLSVVFHRASGLSHIVAMPLPDLLDVLGDAGWLSPGDAASRLADRFDIDGDEAALTARLDELVAAGLAERA